MSAKRSCRPAPPRPAWPARSCRCPGRATAHPVLADTGCRLKKADNAYQPCSDGTAGRSPRSPPPPPASTPTRCCISATTTTARTPAPTTSPAARAARGAMAGTLAGRPVQARRAAAGQGALDHGARQPRRMRARRPGWYRFLDTRPYASATSCDNPADDNTANYSEPYAVTLGSESQVIVFDTAKVGKAALKTTDAQFGLSQTAAVGGSDGGQDGHEHHHLHQPPSDRPLRRWPAPIRPRATSPCNR